MLMKSENVWDYQFQLSLDLLYYWLVMKILIIQPGRLGDILICLPIAKFYKDLGHEIYWPVLSEYSDTFNNIDYVEPIEIFSGIGNCVSECYKMTGDYDKVIDLSFGFPGSQVNSYHMNTEYASNFVEAKYKLSSVPYENRWNLSFTRNLEKENSLFKLKVSETPYTLVHDTGSSGRLITFNDPHIVVQPISGYNIFDWYKVANESSEIYCIDSSFCHFIETVKEFKDKKKYFVDVRNNIPWTKTIWKNNWNIIK